MIRELTPLPFVMRREMLRDGLLQPAPQLCRNCLIRNCAKIGYDGSQSQIAQTCNKGVRFKYFKDAFGYEVVWIGFLVKGEPYDHRALPHKRHLIEVTAKEIAATEERFSEGGEVHKKALDIQKRGESRALHDIKAMVNVLNRQVTRRTVKTALEDLPSQSNGVNVLKETILDATYVVEAIMNQIALSDYIVAPEGHDTDRLEQTDIYRLFHKNVKIYNALAQGRRVTISSPDWVSMVRGVPQVFSLLPSILLENALKYSRGNQDVTVRFRSQNGRAEVSVESFGPVIPEVDRNRIWGPGIRFVHNNDIDKGGTGYGLSLAKQICLDSSFEISYQVSHEKLRGGVPCGRNTFVVREKVH